MATNTFLAAPGVTKASDFQTSQNSMDRRQKLIESLMQQQMPKGQMVGDIYVPPSLLETVAKGLSPIAGHFMNKRLEEDRAKSAQAYQTGMQGEMKSLAMPDGSGYVPREQILSMMTSQYPELRQRGSTEMGKLDAMDTPFMRQFGRGMFGGARGPGMSQVPSAPGGVQTFPVPDVPPLPNNPAPTDLTGVPPMSAPAGDPLMAQFPNLSPQEVQQLLAMDPSGKQLVEANLKRNSPIVAGNNVFQPQGGGRIGNAPGSIDAMTAVLQAAEQAKAPYGTPIRIETEQGEQVMRPDQFVAAAGGAPQPRTGFQLPQTATAQNFSIPPAQQRVADNDRRGILEAELSKETNPLNRKMLERELAGVQGASPVGMNSGYGPTQRAERTGLFDSDVKQVGEMRSSAAKAGQAMRAIDKIQSGLKGGSFQGAYANVQERAAAFFGPLGINVDTNKLTNTQEVKAFVQNLVIPQVKQLGFNPTDADARRIEESVGNITNDPKALEKIMDVLKADSKRSVEQFRQADAYLRKNRSLEGFDYGFDRPTPSTPAPAAAGTMSLADYYKKIKGGQ